MTAPTARWSHWYTVVVLCAAAVLISYIDRTNISVASIAMQQEFGWNETTKGYVLSAFFVGYMVLMAASGALANRFGGRIVLGAAVLWWSAFTMLTPPAAYLSLPVLIATRIALGLGEAAVFPASINMVGRWVPPASRTKAVAFFTSGLSIGTVVSLPVTGWLVRAFGWPVPFYVFGALGIVWAAYWFAKVRPGRAFDGTGAAIEPAGAAIASGGTPARAAARRAIPWRALLTTPAVWAIVVAHFCSNWSLYVLLAWLPTYFSRTFGVSLANAGLLSAAPWLAYFVMGNVGGAWADRMMKAGRSATFVRKFMQITALVGASGFLLLLPLAGSAAMGMAIMFGACGTLALCLAGFAANPFDVAPRHADVVWGIANTAGTLPGIVGVAVTGWLVDRTGNFNAPLLLTALVGGVGIVVYAAMGSGERKVD
ncbi:MAG TPA: MFS transporter [Gemmatimonadaceae bacterium]|nr:MFS transporter [Gemmatimonadaceae bacterium]